MGDGKLIKFWNDAWIRSCGRLVDVAASNTPHYELQKSVAEYIDVNGCWQIHTIKDYLSPNVVKMVTDMEVSYNTDRADSIAWRQSLVMECAL